MKKKTNKNKEIWAAYHSQTNLRDLSLIHKIIALISVVLGLVLGEVRALPKIMMGLKHSRMSI